MIGARAATIPVRSAADCPHRVRVADLAQPWMLRHQPLEFGIGAVGRTVVDVDHLERPSGQRRSDLVHQRGDVLGLVADRDDDRDRGGVRNWCAHAAPSRQSAAGGQPL